LSPIPFKRLFAQTLISAFLSFSTFFIGFLRVYFFSKNLSMEEFGALSLLLTFSAFLMYVFTLGTYQFLFKSVNEGIERTSSAFWASLTVTILISLVFIITIILFNNSISKWLNLSLFKRELVLTITGTATTAVMTLFLFYHYGLGKNNFQNFLQFLRGSLWVIISVFFSFFLKLTLLQVLVVFNLCMCIILLIAFPWKEWNLLFPFKVDKDAFGRLFKYCIPLLPYFAGVWGIPLIVRTQLNIYDGAKYVAIFSVAYTLMEIVFMFISTITATLSPYFFEEQTDGDKPALFYNIMLKYSILAIIFIVPFIFMLRYDIIQIVASEKYLVAGDYIPLLIFFPLLRIIIIVFEQRFLKDGKTLYLGIIYSVGISLSFLFAIFLIPYYSVYGAIYSSLGSYAFIFICLLIRQRGMIDFVYLNLWGLLKITLILTFTVVILNFFDFSNFLKVIPLSMVTLLSLFLSSVLTKKEKEKIFSLIKIKNRN